jgi:hypothetical protein
MKTLVGKLEFISFWHPIKLITNEGELDLCTEYFQVFGNLNGKKTSMKDGMNNITICADENSVYKLTFEQNDTKDTILMVLDKIDGLGLLNVGSYLPHMLQNLNGMRVIVEFDDTSISIKYDESEQVFELKYTGDGNSCKIPDDKVREICKIGETDCCIFCTVGKDGFNCEKFDSFMSRTLLDRHSRGDMRASRIGNCKITGRI